VRLLVLMSVRCLNSREMEQVIAESDDSPFDLCDTL
jgi:hypothetical protein